MITEEQKQVLLETRMQRFQECMRAQQYREALKSNQGRVSFELLALYHQMQSVPARTFEMGEQERLEVRALPFVVPGPLAVWQKETTVLILLWDLVMALLLSQRGRLTEVASRAGQVIADAEGSAAQQPFLVYLALALLTLTRDLPTPAQLQLLRDIASSYGHLPLAEQRVSTQQIRQVVAAGFAEKAETVPVPAGAWNVARGLVLAGMAPHAR